MASEFITPWGRKLGADSNVGTDTLTNQLVLRSPISKECIYE